MNSNVSNIVVGSPFASENQQSVVNPLIGIWIRTLRLCSGVESLYKFDSSVLYVGARTYVGLVGITRRELPGQKMKAGRIRYLVRTLSKIVLRIVIRKSS